MLHDLVWLMARYGLFLINLSVLVFAGSRAARHYRAEQKAGLQTLFSGKK